MEMGISRRVLLPIPEFCVAPVDANTLQYYTGVPVVENSLIGVGPFLLASVEMERANFI